MDKKPLNDYEKAVASSPRRECMGSPNGHRWSPTTSNATGIVCSKCGLRGLNREPYPFSHYTREEK